MFIKESIRNSAAVALGLGLLAAGLAMAPKSPPQDPAPQPAAAKPGPQVDRQISHELRFCTLGGTSWRKDFAAKMRLLEFKPPFTAWAIPAPTLRDFLTHAQGDQRANIVQAPKVTTFDGTSAFFENMIDNTITPSVTSQRARPVGATVAVAAGDPSSLPNSSADREISRSSITTEYAFGQIKDDLAADFRGASISKGVRLNEGLTVHITGTATPRGLHLKLAVENTRLLAVHNLVVPGAGAKDNRPEADTQGVMAHVPEIVQSRYEGDWTIPEGESLVISFGPEGIKDEQGKTSLRERLIVLTPRLIILEAEEQSLGIPPADAAKTSRGPVLPQPTAGP